MYYKLSPKINTSKLQNNQKYLYTYNEDFEIVPIFLKEEYIDSIKNLNNCTNINILNNLYNNGYIIKCNEESKSIVISNYNKSKNYLMSQAYYTRTPIECKIELTYKCNLACKYCNMINSKSDELSTENIKDLVDQLRDLGVIKLSLTGGEIFLRKDIFEIIDYCANKGFVLILQSNGILIDDEIINFLKKYKNILLKISFHSVDSEKFDDFTQVNNSYDLLIEKLNILDESGIKFKLLFNVTSDNECDYDKTIKFFEENEYDYILNSDIYPSISSKDKDNLKYFSKIDTLKKIVNKECSNKDKVHYTHRECDAAKMRLRIDPDGNVVPCGLIRTVLGNIKTNKLKDIWVNNVSQEFINSEVFNLRKECIDCYFISFCSKCNAMYLFYPDWDMRKQTYCQKAKLISEYYKEKDNEKSIVSKSHI